ncbi:MAG: tetratricopeptide repeat protein [Spirochaetota bacterium]
MFFKIINISVLLIFLLNTKIIASENELIRLAQTFNRNGEYYNAITETMRYQYLYPNGVYYPLSMLIQSEAFYKGGNYSKAIYTLSECHEKFKNTPEGEKAFYKTGYIQLAIGNPHLAFRKFQEYNYLYKDGSYIEDISRDLCYTLALMKDMKEAKSLIGQYEETYSGGKYLQEIKDLQLLIDEEINRPKKSVWVSVLGSIALPGFGHFYTGQYYTGMLSLVSNAVLIYLFYDGYRDRNKLRMILFGVTEFSFYQYSLYSAVRNVYEYNSSENFYKSVQLSAEKEF